MITFLAANVNLQFQPTVFVSKLASIGPLARVERIAQPVAQQIEGEDGDKDHDAGEGGDMGKLADQRAAIG